MRLRIVGVAVVVLASCVCPRPPIVHAAESAIERAQRVLSKTGFSYTKHGASTWTTEFDKKNLGKFRVIVSVRDYDAPLVTFVVVAKKANVDKTAELMDKLALANYEYDYVKIGMDNDGDMFVRIDNNLRKVDAEQMKATINQVANVSDELFGKISGSITH